MDRYEHESKVLKNLGWLLDLILRNTRNYVVNVLKERKVVHVMDECCGTGTFSRYLRNSGIKVTGVDTSPSMLSLARKKAPDIPFIQSLAMHKDSIYLITKKILWLFKLIIVTIWDIELIN